MRGRLGRCCALVVACFALGAMPAHADGPGPLPPQWPATLKIGVESPTTEAATLRAKGPFASRAQFLDYTSAANNWSTYEPGGAFITTYVRESLDHGMTPVFSYYVLKGMTGVEGPAEAVTLADTQMASEYLGLLKLFFQRAGGFPGSPIVLHVEPDMWAFLQGLTPGGNAGSIPAVVAATGMPELAGLDNSLAGFAQAIVRLRDLYAPNVLLGWHLSNWGPGFDIRHLPLDDLGVDAVARAIAAYYGSLGARFDLTFVDIEEHDYGHWAALGADRSWDAGAYARQARLLRTYNRLTGQRFVMWQIPMGNTLMRAVDNTPGHWEDNHVQWLLDDPRGPHLAAYLDAGVVGLMFGRGSPDDTCACDAMGDGVRDGPAWGSHTQASWSADDDGGLLAARVNAYAAGGELALPVGAIEPLPPVAPPVSVPPPAPPPAPAAIAPAHVGVTPAKAGAGTALAPGESLAASPLAFGSSLAAAPLVASSYVTLPATRRCGDGSPLRIRLRRTGAIARASALVDGRRVRAVSGRRLLAPIELRALPRAPVTVRVVVVLRDGRSVRASRRYGACAAR